MAVTGAIVFGAGMGYLNSQGAMQQADFNSAVAESNAKMYDLKAQRATEIGDKAEIASRQRTAQTIGTQRVAIAGQGVDVTSGTALAIQEETAAIGDQDALTIKNNAFLEAMGYRQEAQNKRFSAKAESLAAENKQRNAIITGGINGAMYGSGGKVG